MSTYAPSWYLRAGYGRLLLWCVDAEGDPVTAAGTVDTAMVRPLAYSPGAPDERVTGLGTVDERATVRAVLPEIASWPDVHRLRTWKADGRSIVGVVFAAGRGRHLLWREPVPVILTPFSDGRGTLEGDRLRMETHLYAPDVTEDPDLLAGATWEEDGDDETTTVALPAPGLTALLWAVDADGSVDLGAGDLTAEALAADGTTVLSSDTDPAPTLRLPAGTWFVRVTAPEGVRPVLTTYPADPSMGTGGYLLFGVHTEEGGAILGAYGEGTITAGTATVTLLGVEQTIAVAELGSPAIASTRTRSYGHVVTVDTIPVA